VTPSPAGARRSRRPLFLWISGLLVASVVVAAHDVMLPFVLAALVAYVVMPLVTLAERRRVPRSAAIALVYTVVLGALFAVVQGTAPRIAFEFRNLGGELPALSAEVRDHWLPAAEDALRAVGLTSAPPALDEADQGPTSAFVARPQADGSIAIDVGTGVGITETPHGFVVEPAHEKKDDLLEPNKLVAEAFGKTMAYAQHNSLEFARAVRDFVASVSRAVFIFFITLMMAAYIMLTREHILAFFRSLVSEPSRAAFDALVTRVDSGLAGVVRGQLIICLINGVLSALGFALVGLKYWPVMALLAAVFSLVPIFGSIASSVPAVAVALTQGLGTATFTLLWIVLIHQLEANFLNPKIMGDAAKIHPVLVIFSLIVGEHFFHVVGALLAVPTMSIAQSLFLHVRATIDGAEAEMRELKG
jgi:predicted PurR-regulated permease PerM